MKEEFHDLDALPHFLIVALLIGICPMKDLSAAIPSSQIEVGRTLLEAELSSDHRRGQSSGHRILDLDFGPPTRAVTGHQYIGIESLEVCDGWFQDCFIGPYQVITSYHCMQFVGPTELQGMFCGIDYPRMTAAGEHNDSFAWRVLDTMRHARRVLKSPFTLHMRKRSSRMSSSVSQVPVASSNRIPLLKPTS